MTDILTVRDRKTGVKVAVYGDDTGTPERARHSALTETITEVDGFSRAIAMRTNESPLDKYLAMWRKDEAAGEKEAKRRGINPDQHTAGIRFRSDYELAGKSVGLRTPSAALISRGGKDITDAILDAMHRTKKAFEAIKNAGRIGASVAESVCCHSCTCADVDREKGWPKGTAMIRLREALDDLVEHYAPDTKKGKGGKSE